jgi:hypothetical protein
MRDAGTLRKLDVNVKLQHTNPLRSARQAEEKDTLSDSSLRYASF